MRISLNDTDPGYKEWLRLASSGVDVFSIKVRQNGLIVEGALTADSDVGLTVRYKRDAAGHMEVDHARSTIVTELVYGPVEIIMPPSGQPSLKLRQPGKPDPFDFANTRF